MHSGDTWTESKHIWFCDIKELQVQPAMKPTSPLQLPLTFLTSAHCASLLLLVFCPGNWSCDLSHAGKPSTSWATSPALCVFSILRQGLLSCLGWLDLNLQLAISFNLQSCLILQVPCPAFPWSLIQFYSKDLLIDTINKMRLWRFRQLTKGISKPNLSGPAQVELYPLYRWSEKNRKHVLSPYMVSWVTSSHILGEKKK